MSSEVETRKSGVRWQLVGFLAALCLGVVLVLAAVPLAIKLGSFHSYRISSNSMAPTLYAGDKIFENEDYYTHHKWADGDLVVFRHGNLILAKRVSALPGETIEGKGDKLIRNGVALVEPYAVYSKENPIPEIDTFALRKVPAGEIFVTGDSRDLSLDSRSADFAPVLISNVLGRVSIVYTSSHRGQTGRTF
ncbi:MAG: signal peptidase I [Acidobacteriaceae bacterium]